MPGAPRPPVLFVFGAFGSGKSTIAPLVATELHECLVVEVDWLLEPLSRIAGRRLTEDSASWPPLRDFWLVLASIAARGGRPSLFFGPEEPATVENLPSRSLLGDSHWLLLDCNDAEIERRLEKREGWLREWTLDGLKDAARYRQMGFPAVHSDDAAPETVARCVVDWARGVLSRTGAAGPEDRKEPS
jgi:hypothetical protein